MNNESLQRPLIIDDVVNEITKERKLIMWEINLNQTFCSVTTRNVYIGTLDHKKERFLLCFVVVVVVLDLGGGTGSKIQVLDTLLKTVAM